MGGAEEMRPVLGTRARVLEHCSGAPGGAGAGDQRAPLSEPRGCPRRAWIPVRDPLTGRNRPREPSFLNSANICGVPALVESMSWKEKTDSKESSGRVHSCYLTTSLLKGGEAERGGGGA